MTTCQLVLYLFLIKLTPLVSRDETTGYNNASPARERGEA